MLVTEMVYAPMATKQLIYKFNKEHKTNIEYVKTEYMDGTPFVTLDLNKTPSNLIFKFGYVLGEGQEYLATKGEELLPLKDYPFPSKEEN